MIKAILFDMDGVLINARDWHYEALNRALDLFGMAIDRDAHLATYDGLPTLSKLQMLSKTRGLPVRLHSFINDLKQAYTAEIANALCKPVFQHRYALSRLKGDGYRLAVCSNSVRQSVQLMMTLSALAPYLDRLWSNEDVVQPKPDPEIYLRALADFGILPEEALILEDNDHGVQAARASGAHVMVIGSPDDVTYAAIIESIRQVEQG